MTGPAHGGGRDAVRDWRDIAACLEVDPELFFPIGNTGPSALQIEQARAVCERCRVRGTCLDWALDTSQGHGVWGGMSEDERRALQACAAPDPELGPGPTKTCARCREAKTADAYGRDRSTRDGRNNNCRECRSELKRGHSASRRIA